MSRCRAPCIRGIVVLREAGGHRSAPEWCDTLPMTEPGQLQQKPRTSEAASGGAWVFARGRVRGGTRGRAARFALAVAVYFSLAMLVAQTLGMLHGILHNPGGYAAGATVANEPASQPQKASANHSFNPGNAGHASFLTQLFSGHLAGTDCRAYDQLSHCDAAPGFSALALPLVLTPFLLSTLTGLATARWHALFQARGPPSLR